jgi:acetyl-CoA carboxylase biotin carboxyl carrier protein
MGLINVRSEITGSVWKILVKEGEQIKEGDELMIMESMKMEIPVIAPSNGVVKKVNINEGEALTEGHIAFLIES